MSHKVHKNRAEEWSMMVERERTNVYSSVDRDVLAAYMQ